MEGSGHFLPMQWETQRYPTCWSSPLDAKCLLLTVCSKEASQPHCLVSLEHLSGNGCYILQENLPWIDTQVSIEFINACCMSDASPSQVSSHFTSRKIQWGSLLSIQL